MVSIRRLLLVLIALAAAAAPALGLSDSTTDELEQNRQLLEQWKSDPAHLEKLRRDWAAYRALPPERQARLRQLERDLHGEDNKAARLRCVLDRYNQWLQHLPELDRKRIETARSSQERLQIIKEIRERQWVEQLPRALREKVENASPPDRPTLIARLRQEERTRREDWLIAQRHWAELVQKKPLPARISDLSADAQEFVNDYLRPLLGKEEEERLKKAEGQWPLFPKTLVELVDKHPYRLPGPAKGPSSLEELPGEFRTRLTNRLEAADQARLKQAKGKWPQFAIVVSDIAHKNNVSCPAFGPVAPEELAPRSRQFLQGRLLNPKFGVLDRDEKRRLRMAEKNWPFYPRTLFELAHKHHLDVPGPSVLVSLPGPPQEWDKYRLQPRAVADRLPEVPYKFLREFAMAELKDKDHSQIELLLSDPITRERLKQEFFKKHPEMLDRLRRGEKPGRRFDRNE